MRKLLALILLAAFGLPFASPLLALAPGGDARLPLCCRKGGRHDCMGASMGHGAETSSAPAWRAKRECCPFCATASTAAAQEALPAGERYRIVATDRSERLFEHRRSRRFSTAVSSTRRPRGPPSSQA